MTISHDDYRKARTGDIVAICDISGDEFVRAADGSTFCRNGDTGNYVAMSKADFDAAVNVVMDNNDAASRMWDADDARASAQAAADANAAAVRAAVRVAFPAITDAAVDTFMRRYGDAWWIDGDAGIYDGYGDGVMDRLATLVAACA